MKKMLKTLLITCVMIGWTGVVAAQVQVPDWINGMDSAGKAKLLQQYTGRNPANQVVQSASPQTQTPARKPPPSIGPVAGFEQRQNLKPFGLRLMESAGEYTTLLDIPVPGDYDLGPGDVIELQLFGKENRTYSLAVNRDAQINLPDIGPMSVSGMTFESASKTILERISKQKIGVEASVTMGQLRSIQVFLTGDVNFPGTYTTHALTTVTNALLAAGGVRPTGSLRKVELRRGGRTISRLDLYDVLLRGSIAADRRLQPGDVIFVPPVGARVAVDTGVNRPAIYELLGEVQLQDVVALAGGLLPTAFPAGSKLERIAEDGSRNAIQVNLTTSAGASMAVKDGDILSIPASLARVDGVVSLLGAVERLGDYPWRQGMQLSDLLTHSGLLKRGAWRMLGLIGRTDPLSGAVAYLPFSPADVFAGTDSTELKSDDQIFLLGAEDVEFLGSANVQFVLAGRIPPKQFSEKAQLVVDRQDIGQDSKIRDQVVGERDVVGVESQAGMGSQADICPGLIELAIIVEREGASRFRSASLNVSIESSGDRMHKVMACPSLYATTPRILPAVLEHSVTVRGEVRSPGLLPAAPGVALSVLLRAAGGVTRDADTDNVEVLRQELIENNRNDVRRMVFTVKTLDEARLAAGDIVNVARRYTLQDSGSVRIVGEVVRPGVFDIRRGERLSEVLMRAGGITPHAYPFGAVFQRARIKEEKRSYYQRAGLEMQNAVLLMVARQKRTQAGADAATFAAMHSFAEELRKVEPSGRMVVEADPTVLQVHPELDVVLEPGDEVVIPKRPSHVVVMGEVLNPGAVQFKSGLRASDYLRAAGGAAQSADESRTYMILPNGSAEPLKVASWNAQPTPVPPGSVIYVPRDPLPLDNTALLQTALEIAKDVALTAASLYSITK